MSGIVTVTLNPAIDLTVALAGLTPGQVHRAQAAETNAGGKGVNVAGCVADWGAAVTATGVLGAGNDAAFVRLFADKGIVDRFVRAEGDTRTNIKIADTATGETTDVNMPGLKVDAATLAAVDAVLDAEVGPDTLAVLSGSLPAGAPETAWAAMIARLDRRGARVLLDTSGAPLARALAAPAGELPFAIKPNRLELEAWAGVALPDAAALVATARRLIGRGVALVAVSLGEDGAVFVTADEALVARLPPIRTLSTVGAGDAMVAGLATGLADNLPLADLARRAVAFATAKLGRIGSHLPPRPEVERLAGAVTLTSLPASGEARANAR
jgi:1-phosphofructokinase